MGRRSKQTWTVDFEKKIGDGTSVRRPDAVLTRWSAKGEPEVEVVLEWKPIKGRDEVVMILILSPGFRTPLTAADLRSIPFSIIENQERSRISEKSTKSNIERDLLSPEATRGAHSGKPLTDNDLQLVADLYREAHRTGCAIHRYVAEHLGVSESTAGKRVVAARREGFLGAALGTRAGEDTRDTQTKKRRKKVEK